MFYFNHPQITTIPIFYKKTQELYIHFWRMIDIFQTVKMVNSPKQKEYERNIYSHNKYGMSLNIV